MTTDLTVSEIAQRWQLDAAEEIWDIGEWRGADSGDRYHHYWRQREAFLWSERDQRAPISERKPTSSWVTELRDIQPHGFCFPLWFTEHTAAILEWFAVHAPKVDITPITDVRGWIVAWHDDHTAERIPSQQLVTGRFEEVRALLGMIYAVDFAERDAVAAVEVKPEIPAKLIPLQSAARLYPPTARTLNRWVKEGELIDFRPKGHAQNEPILLDEEAVARKCGCRAMTK